MTTTVMRALGAAVTLIALLVVPAPDVFSVTQPGKAVAETRWLPPLGAPLRLAAPFRAPPSPYAAGHRGIDLPSSPGANVRAPVAGTVSFVGTVVDREVLSIRVDERTVLSLEPVSTEGAGIEKGDSISRGQSVGVVDRGGHCASACLHLGVRIDGEYVNPMRFFLGRPRLLPWADPE